MDNSNKYSLMENLNPLLMQAVNESRGNLIDAFDLIEQWQDCDFHLHDADVKMLNDAEELLSTLIRHGYNKLS